MSRDNEVYETFKEKKIGLALSGGGYRAAAFHLGVLSYLAQNELLENVTHLSTVSGGSLMMGLVYKLNNYQWPSSQTYLEHVHQNAMDILETTSLLEEESWLAAAIGWLTNGKYAAHASVLEKVKKEWHIDVSLQALEESPIWTINTTTGETGKSCRFEKSEMRDYKLGKISNPDFNLADILVASAGFPLVIGPLVVDLTQHHFIRANKSITYKNISLYDGGLYDNLGTEVFFKDNFSKLPNHVDFLIVSDASKPFNIQKDMYRLGRRSKAQQIIDISTEQIRSLRSRMFYKLIYRKNQPNLGTYIRLGSRNTLLPEEAKCAKKVSTDLKALTHKEMQCLITHGFTATQEDFMAYCQDLRA